MSKLTKNTSFDQEAVANKEGSREVSTLYDNLLYVLEQRNYRTATLIFEKIVRLYWERDFKESDRIPLETKEVLRDTERLMGSCIDRLSVSPGSEEANYNLALIAMTQHAYLAASMYLDKVIKSNHRNMKAYFHRGVARATLYRYGEALEDLKRAIEFGVSFEEDDPN